MKNNLPNFKGKTILVTGAEGYKGKYLCLILEFLGANVKKVTRKTRIIESSSKIDGIIHLAADTIVSEFQKNPSKCTKNTIGIFLDFIDIAKLYHIPLLVATTDKVYKPKTTEHKEGDQLWGSCPYSAAKVFIENYIEVQKKIYAESTGNLFELTWKVVRAANCIGGHDKNLSRLIPDLFDKIKKKEPLTIRNPKFKRPYIYMLDALWAYLIVFDRMVNGYSVKDLYNIGAVNGASCEEIGKLFESFIPDLKIQYGASQEFHEDHTLNLDFSLASDDLKFVPIYDNMFKIIGRTVEDQKLSDEMIVADYLHRREVLEYKYLPAPDRQGVFEDLRGETIGADIEVVGDGDCLTSRTFIVKNKKGVARGMHRQECMNRRVTVLSGKIIDFVVSKDRNATNKYIMGKGDSIYITEDKYHGYLSLTESEIMYQTDDTYRKENEERFNAVDMFTEEARINNINEIIMSERDKQP